MNNKILATMLFVLTAMLVSTEVASAQMFYGSQGYSRANGISYYAPNSYPQIGFTNPVYDARIGGAFPNQAFFFHGLRGGIETGRPSFQSYNTRYAVSSQYYPRGFVPTGNTRPCGFSGYSISSGCGGSSYRYGGSSFGRTTTGFAGFPRGNFGFGGASFDRGTVLTGFY